MQLLSENVRDFGPSKRAPLPCRPASTWSVLVNVPREARALCRRGVPGAAPGSTRLAPLFPPFKSLLDVCAFVLSTAEGGASSLPW